MWISDIQKVGAGLAGAGFLFFFLGILFFFDSRLLAFGNLLFVGGIVLIIGPAKTFAFFTRPNKIKASFAFVMGIVLILFKYSFIGFACEMLGFISLFGDFFGVIIGFLRQVPIIGSVLSSPAIAPYVDRIANARILPI